MRNNIFRFPLSSLFPWASFYPFSRLRRRRRRHRRSQRAQPSVRFKRRWRQTDPFVRFPLLSKRETPLNADHASRLLPASLQTTTALNLHSIALDRMHPPRHHIRQPHPCQKVPAHPRHSRLSHIIAPKRVRMNISKCPPKGRYLHHGGLSGAASRG